MKNKYANNSFGVGIRVDQLENLQRVLERADRCLSHEHHQACLDGLKWVNEAIKIFEEQSTSDAIQFRKRADQIHSDHLTNFDDDAIVSIGEGGAWVQGWIYVTDEQFDDPSSLED